MNLVVSRKHINGNLTYAAFLVDLYCLGVKDTTFAFNRSVLEYDEMITSYNQEDFRLKRIDYKLAHNIIFAGYDFATEIGLPSHPDFNKTTRFILEEDDEKIELIEVACGMNGIPTLIMGPDNEAECKRTMVKLNFTIGESGYRVINEIESWNDDIDEDAEENFRKPYSNEQFILDREFLREKMRSKKKSKESERKEYVDVLYRFFQHFVDDEKVNEAYEEITTTFDIEITHDYLSAEFLGIDGSLEEIDIDLKSKIEHLLAAPKNKTAKLLKSLKKEYPEVPGIGFMDIYFADRDNREEIIKLINENHTKFPNYKLFGVMRQYMVPLNAEELSTPIKLEINRMNIFGDRKTVNWIEATYFLKLFLFQCMAKNDPNQIAAFLEFLGEGRFPEEITELLTANGYTMVVLYVESIIYGETRSF